MKTATLARTQTRTTAKAGEKYVARTALVSMAAPAALIGLWSVACLVSAVIHSGGPLALATAWFQAIAGV